MSDLNDAIREAEAMEPLDVWRARVEREQRAAGLSEAWAEAEAALPEGWVIWGLQRFAGADPAKDVFSVWANRWERGAKGASGSGPTPAAALRALAEKLRLPEVPEGER